MQLKRPVARLPFLMIATLLVTPCLAGSPIFTDRSRIESQTPKTLIVTHASLLGDPDRATKAGADEIVRWATSQGHNVYYLKVIPENGQDGHPLDELITDYEPTAYIRSLSGEHNISVKSNNLILAGGNLNACLGRTAAHALKNSKFQSFNITIPMNAVYGADGSHCPATFNDCYNKYPEALPSMLDGFIESIFAEFKENENIKTNPESYKFKFYLNEKEILPNVGSRPKIVHIRLENRSSKRVPSAPLRNTRKVLDDLNAEVQNFADSECREIRYRDAAFEILHLPAIRSYFWRMNSKYEDYKILKQVVTFLEASSYTCPMRIGPALDALNSMRKKM